MEWFTEMDRAYYYCCVLRTGVWRHIRYARRCWHCGVSIEPGTLYLDTGVRRPNTPSKFSHHAICSQCAEVRLPKPETVADYNPSGMTEYGLDQLRKLKLLIGPVKS